MAQSSGPRTEVERLAHYWELAAHLGDGPITNRTRRPAPVCWDMARQYDRLAAELRGRIDAALRESGLKSAWNPPATNFKTCERGLGPRRKQLRLGQSDGVFLFSGVTFLGPPKPVNGKLALAIVQSNSGGAAMADQARNQEYTIAFLRLAAVEMRRLAERAPEIAVQLRHIARQLQREADDLDTPDIQ